MTPVYLQGMGLMSCLGAGLPKNLDSLEPPTPARRSINGLDDSVPYLPIKVDEGSGPEVNWRERCKKLLTAAIVDAGCHNNNLPIFLGSSSGNVGAVSIFDSEDTKLPQLPSQIVDILDWTGPVYWINSACTSGSNALLQAKSAIEKGVIDEALVIGLELENYLSIAGFAGMQMLASDRARPLHTDRSGLLLGEAIAAVHLSTKRSRWQLCGGAHLVESKDPSGANEGAYKAMMQQTLRSLKLGVGDIDLVKLQSAGSVVNDVVEARAISDLFDVLPPLISLKTLLGHTLGASGVAELVLLLTVINQRQWPAVRLRDEDVDKDCGINFTATMPAEIEYLMSVNLGFGGSHSCLLLKQHCHD
ncbi:beta-ketoacyl synthase N-terminal-like domain-containing protein [Simiduia aestuariiviva]|uniref:3-oxoacyl-[acyl-carrier-protein] synthase-1 n=1 Tax=Simiduia aestuariiviva TaxID=1510459 RepID=A0A839UL14_9GAMM|nr:beta-ketoacyl synthase N-terminal-like domain-containing protein [Simiduia aestuariiviva]MBB3168333.1 3-oxoacyl-[acyl-carrier-protein] synthase-1 [Simiduia aestuariiviva]